MKANNVVQDYLPTSGTGRCSTEYVLQGVKLSDYTMFKHLDAYNSRPSQLALTLDSKGVMLQYKRPQPGYAVYGFRPESDTFELISYAIDSSD